MLKMQDYLLIMQKHNLNRNKSLFEKGVIARQAFENSELNFNNAKQV